MTVRVTVTWFLPRPQRDFSFGAADPGNGSVLIRWWAASLCLTHARVDNSDARLGRRTNWRPSERTKPTRTAAKKTWRETRTLSGSRIAASRQSADPGQEIQSTPYGMTSACALPVRVHLLPWRPQSSVKRRRCQLRQVAEPTNKTF